MHDNNDTASMEATRSACVLNWKVKNIPLPKHRLNGNKRSNEERRQEIRTIIIDGLEERQKIGKIIIDG
jgi:hypothetical protein